jgi:phosphoglycolate phosphatase
LRLIVFDMDGTLIDTHGLIAEHMAAAFTSAGLDIPTPADVQRIIGLSLPVAIGRLTGSDDRQMVEALAEQYKTLYLDSIRTHGRAEPLYPGAREALDRLVAIEGNRLGIATGKELPAVNRILERHGILGHFTTLQTPDHNPSKPHPGMLLSAMTATGVGPAGTVMIGDTTFDMELARAAGTRAIGVAWGYHERQALEGAGADILVERYEDLDDAIDKVLS